MAEALSGMPTGHILTKSARVKIMAQHGDLWRQCSATHQQGWETQAIVFAAKRELQLQGQRDHA
eukprot:12040113-Heterocapsa_arctica.AAC.1